MTKGDRTHTKRKPAGGSLLPHVRSAKMEKRRTGGTPAGRVNHLETDLAEHRRTLADAKQRLPPYH